MRFHGQGLQGMRVYTDKAARNEFDDCLGDDRFRKEVQQGWLLCVGIPLQPIRQAGAWLRA